MVNNKVTRSSENQLDDSLQSLEAKLKHVQEDMINIQATLGEIAQKQQQDRIDWQSALKVQGQGLDQSNARMEDMLRQLDQLVTNNQGNNHRGILNGGIQINPNPNSNFARFSKIEFPKFWGDDIQGWLYKVEQVFEVDSTSGNIRVKLVSIHLEGKALLWHQSLMKTRPIGDWPTWSDYKAAILLRFGTSPYDDPTAEIMNLRQKGSVENYQDQFDSILNRTDLTEKQAISCFLKGLDTDIQSTNSPSFTPNFFSTTQHSNNSTKNAFQKIKSAELSKKEVQERRAKNLYFNCNETWAPNHKCTTQLHSIQVLTLEADEGDGSDSGEGLAEGLEQSVQSVQYWQEDTVPPLISLNVIHGNASYQTMRVTGKMKGNPIHILIDSGSTHNFLDTTTTHKLGCQIKSTCPFMVTVANGETIISKSMCQGFKWHIQGHGFATDVKLVPLGGCEMVLGIQWLESLGPVLWDFKQIRMEFTVQKRKHVLRGCQSRTLQWVSAKQMQTTLAKQPPGAQLFAMRAYPLLECTNMEGSYVDPIIQGLLQEFEDVFKEPTTLPQHREHDHQIHIKEGIAPVNLRPYRYPVVQKDAIEQIVNEMLEPGVVRPSQSPFSFPIVMVKKKDGTWRLCVDYRELNKSIIRDTFPMPVIEELLDELHGAAIFSKIDLRSGYWQIRMHPRDIPKTAFRTHEGHYEFLVMPFGLTNAPSTFQHLMNSIFKPYLRKFILVFFDDILIYSKDITQHVQHLRLAFEILRQHTLFAKMSKCSFGSTSIEYLGYIICDKGVSTAQPRFKPWWSGLYLKISRN
ncbi:uncharacterized protein LOC141607104 [Silene latifolia]|uniref:uncharacterized protein LOC141607104 n=1 Tax=Silene latifolia TaxID=37657 RepID=UPI003D76E693